MSMYTNKSVDFDHELVVSFLHKALGQELSELGSVQSIVLFQGNRRLKTSLRWEVTFALKNRESLIIPARNSESDPNLTIVDKEEIPVRDDCPASIFLKSRIDQVVDISSHHRIPNGFVYVWQVLALPEQTTCYQDLVLDLIRSSNLDSLFGNGFSYDLNHSLKNYFRRYGYFYGTPEETAEVFNFCLEDEKLKRDIDHYITQIVPELCASFTSQPSG